MKNTPRPRLYLVSSKKGLHVHQMVRLMEALDQELYRLHTTPSSILFATDDETITPTSIMHYATQQKCHMLVLELDARLLGVPGACTMRSNDKKSTDAYHTVSLAMKKERYAPDGANTQRLVDRILDRIAGQGIGNVLNFEIRLLDRLARHL